MRHPSRRGGGSGIVITNLQMVFAERAEGWMSRDGWKLWLKKMVERIEWVITYNPNISHFCLVVFPTPLKNITVVKMGSSSPGRGGKWKND